MEPGTRQALVVDPADWRRTLAVNLDGAFFCARAAAPLLIDAGGGCILNIASHAALSEVGAVVGIPILFQD